MLVGLISMASQNLGFEKTLSLLVFAQLSLELSDAAISRISLLGRE